MNYPISVKLNHFPIYAGPVDELRRYKAADGPRGIPMLDPYLRDEQRFNYGLPATFIPYGTRKGNLFRGDLMIEEDRRLRERHVAFLAPLKGQLARLQQEFDRFPY